MSDSLARAAYDAFVGGTGNKRLPGWDKLPEAHRSGWIAATRAIASGITAAAAAAITESYAELDAELAREQAA